MSLRSVREAPVITAIVLVKAEVHRIPEVAEAIAQLPAVSEVYSITGNYDLVAIVRVRAHDDLADVIPGGLNKVDGVTATQTHVAFRAYSRHDLEAAFSIGLTQLFAGGSAARGGTTPLHPPAWGGFAPP
jgi:DNA-binding Lrp family transcriptional regulator